MKKIYFLLCLVLTTIAGTAQLVTEPFNYTPDPALGLSAQSANTWRIVNSGDSILIDAGSLSYPALASSTGNKVKFDGGGTDYFRSFTNQTTGTVYASFLLNLSSLGGLNATGGYFFMFTDGSSSSNHGATVWVRLSGTGYNIGVNSRTTAANTAWLSPTLSTNTTYLVVVSYSIVSGTANDYASIWLNPVTLGGAAPPADAQAIVAATDLTNVGRVQLRQDGTSATPFVQVDEIRIAADYATVTPKDPAFTTPTLNVSPLASFGSQCINSTYGPNSFNIGGMNLTTADITVGPLAGYTFSTTAGGTYTNTLTLTQTGGNYFQTVYVKFTPTAVQSYNGNIPVTGGGATATNVAAVGAGISAPVVTTGGSSAITTSGATLAGTIVNNGCSAPTAYGIEYSTTNNFTPGTGTQVASTNLSGSGYTSVLTGLNPGVTYYYIAYATNASGTGYGSQSSFTTAVPPAPTQAPVATAATAITANSFTANWNSTTEATSYRLDVFTESTASLTNTNIAAWTGSQQYIPKYADTGTIYNVVNVDSITTNATNGITNANGPSGGVGTTPNPFAVQATGWDAGADTKYWEIMVNTTGATNMTLSSLQGSSATGPANFKVQYKIGSGGTYTDLPGGTVPAMTTAVQAGQLNTWSALSNVAIPVAAEGQPAVYFRWIMTNNTSVNGGTVANTGTSRLGAVYIKGNYNGTVRNYVSGFQNLNSGNVTSYAVTGLTPSTTYYYVVRAENAAGYSQNSNKITVTTSAGATPAITTTTLADFGNVCLNVTSSENSFTINGTNLTAADVTVGPLAGYSFSTTAAGTYAPTLTLTQPGGTYSQQVFVKLTPAAVQSYNGNIPVSGGGLATTVNVAATGAGVNTPPSVTTGASSGVTSSSATLAGTITATGCSAISGYGVSFSTTSGFVPASGTIVAGTNLSGGGFTVTVSGLTPNTTYYYVVYATNAGGTVYGTQMSFTTGAAPSLTAGTLTTFGNQCVNTSSTPGSFTVTGSNLTGDVTVNALAGYTYATSNGGPFTSTLTLTPASGSINTTVFVQFTPTAVQTYNGPIVLSGGGAASQNVTVSGSGVNTAATVTTGAATGVSTAGATLPGTITATGCTAVSAYGIVWSTTNGFNPATTGTSVAGSNLAGGNFSVTLSGLAPNTTYYYVAYVTNAGGTTYGAQQSFTTTSNPTATAGVLAGFGGVCINTASSVNSFTVSGSNLASNLTVNALAGYAYSTSASGPFTSTLNLTVAGNAINTTVFVQLTPTAVQSYNGNIQITGGGLAAAVNVAATGFGINTAPAVTTGAASAVTSTSATLAGSITATGCTAISGYGIKWSTVNGFDPATTGTQVAGSNLAGGAFSVNLSGLTPSTTYYFVVYATNAGGTTYGTQQSFTTLTPAVTATALTGFGNVCVTNASTANSFTITGTNLTATDIVVGPLAGYTFSTTNGGTYTNTLTITPAAGSVNQQVFVKLTPTAVQSYNGNITITGGGLATAVNVAATGAGVNTQATVTAGTATGVTTSGATIPGSVTANGCSNVTAYGVIWSTTNGFNPATTGTNVAGSGITGGNYSVTLTGLAAGTTYYYVTYATNAGGTAYSAQGSFTTSAAAIPVAPVATAATNITGTGFTANWNAVAGATGYFIDVYTLGAGSGTATVAGWDMATNTSVAAASTANLGTAANINIAQLTTNTGGTLSTPTGFSGTGGTPNPYSVSSNTWNGGNGTKYWQIDINTVGQTGLTLTSNQGSSATGPKDWKAQYRVGNTGAFTDIPGSTIALTTAVVPGTPATWGTLTNLPIPAAAENQPLVQIRWIMTSDNAINGSAVASGGTSRISGIYVKSTSAGTVPVYVTGYQNQATGNVTSYAVTGLTPNTTYYYVVRATNAAGTSPNSNEITVTTLAGPQLTATTLTAFGNVCQNTTSAANSFTITGSNLTAGNVTVGPLAGYAFSTTAAGTYNATLNIPTTGGAFSQQVFVQLTPTAIQSYNGNIPVTGGGVATAINVAATGAGVNSAPTVTTGAASAITNVSATLAGSITATGCSAVSAYGIKWSTVNGFDPATAGTQVAGTNLAGGAFSVNLSGLSAGTTYFYVAYATNAGGTTYGTQQSFITAAGPVVSLTASTLTAFGNTCVGTTSTPNSFTITGVNLTNAPVTVAALPGFQFATSAAGPYSNSLSITQPGGAFSQQVFVQFVPTASAAYSGNIAVAGGGAAATFNVNASGTGVATPPTAITGDSTIVGYDAATLRGSFVNAGCGVATAYGIEYSGIANFTGGSGFRVPATSATAGAFSVNVTGLVPGTTYYYRAYASSASGATDYGVVKSFTLPALQAGLRVWPVPVATGGELRVTVKDLEPGSYGLRLYSAAGEEVVRRYVNIQATYMNERLQVPASLPSGVYVLRVTGNTSKVSEQTIMVLHQ